MGTNDIVKKPSRMMKSVLFVALLVALASQSSGIPEDTFVPETTFREDDADRAYPDTEGASEATEVQESAHFSKHIRKHINAAAKRVTNHATKIFNDAAKHIKKHAKKDDGRRRRRKADEGRRRRRKAEKKEKEMKKKAVKAVEKHVKDAKKAAEKHAEKIKKHVDDMKERAAKKDAAKKKHLDECRKNAETCHAKYADLKKEHAEQEAKAKHHKEKHAYHHTKSKARIHWTELWKWWLHADRAKHAATALYHGTKHSAHAGMAAKLKAEVEKRHKHCGDAFIKCMKKHPTHPHVRRL